MARFVQRLLYLPDTDETLLRVQSIYLRLERGVKPTKETFAAAPRYLSFLITHSDMQILPELGQKYTRRDYEIILGGLTSSNSQTQYQRT